MANERVDLAGSEGGPNPEAKLGSRVSAMRHGVRLIKLALVWPRAGKIAVIPASRPTKTADFEMTSSKTRRENMLFFVKERGAPNLLFSSEKTRGHVTLGRLSFEVL